MVIVAVTLLAVNEFIDIWLCVSVLCKFGLDVSLLGEKSIFDVLTNQHLDYVRQKVRPWSTVNSSWNCLSNKSCRRQPDGFLLMISDLNAGCTWFSHLIFNQVRKYHNCWNFVLFNKITEKLARKTHFSRIHKTQFQLYKSTVKKWTD